MCFGAKSTDSTVFVAIYTKSKIFDDDDDDDDDDYDDDDDDDDDDDGDDNSHIY